MEIVQVGLSYSKDDQFHKRYGPKGTNELKGRKRKPTKDAAIEVTLRNNMGGSSSSSEYQLHTNLLIQLDEDSPTWYKYGNQYDERDATIVTNPPLLEGTKNTTAMVSKYRALADTIYKREVQIYAKNNSDTSDNRWVDSTMKKGTLKDRIAAMSVVVSTDPVHKFHALDGLLQMMGCSVSSHNYTTQQQRQSKFLQQTNSRVAQLAAEAAEDLFLNTLLPPDRKLLTLAQRPLYLYEARDNGSRQGHQEKNDHGNDSQNMNKKKKKMKQNTKQTLSPRILLLWRFEEMVKEKYDLFVREYLKQTVQTSTLEPQKVAAVRSAAKLLRSVPEGEAELLQIITNKIGDPMKKVAAAAGHELRKVLLQHPAMVHVVAREVQQLAHRPNLSNKALYNCITFLNQLRLSNDDDDDDGGTSAASSSLPTSLISTYFRLFEVAVAQQNHAKDGNSKKKKEKDSSKDVGMRSRLLSALLTGVNRAHPYLPEKDKDLEEHIDALYRVVHTAPPAACTQALLLLFHLVIGFPDATRNNTGGQHYETTKTKHLSPTGALSTHETTTRKDRFYRALYATLSQPEMIASGKHLTMYFNLLYKAMKYDTITTRLVAFAKKMLCFTVHCSSAVTIGTLYLLNEVCKAHPVLTTCYEEVMNEPDSTRLLDPSKREPRGALVSEQEGKFTTIEDDDEKRSAGWELSLALHHFHPSVQLFANKIGDEISYTGDPLKDFALAPFLDKFAYRNPKSVERVANKFKRGESIAERKSGTDGIVQSLFSVPVNDPRFLETGKQDVHEEFFHKFFTERAKRDALKGAVKGKTDRTVDNATDALNIDEEANMGEKNIEDLEWETDSEEEAFVDSLALKMMEDANADFGPDDLDDEDPDMDDWNDMNNDGESDQDDSDDENSDNPQQLEEDPDINEHSDDDDDIDAFMEDEGDDDSSDSSGENPPPQFLSEEDIFGNAQEPDIHVENELADSYKEKKSKARSKKADVPTYAAAEDYEELISKSWPGASSRSQEKQKEKIEDSFDIPFSEMKQSKRRKKN